jgi:SAM-dependent methyltransferase
MRIASDLVRVDDSRPCCSSPWEEAYARFETPEQEIAKFMGRLLKLGAANWDKNLRVVELFCGRGNGLQALSRLGFRNLEGVDLSETLLAGYTGDAKCYVCDCRHLPFENKSRDIVIVQGGLHHLPRLPEDLETTLAEIRRILRPDGFAVIIEPWLTPFLHLVHAICAWHPARRLSVKLDALASMIENERETYEQWLDAPDAIRALLAKTFDFTKLEVRWGKITCVGRLAQN